MNRRKDDIDKIKYESIFKFFANALLVVNPENDKVIDINDYAKNLFKVKDYKTVDDVIQLNPSNYKIIKSFLYENIDSTFIDEMYFNRLNKSTFFAEVRAVNIFIKNIPYILLNIKNISEEKEINNKLKRNKEFITSIINVIPDDLNIIDTNKKIIWSNNSKLLGKDVCEKFHKYSCKNCDNSNCYIDKVFKTGKNVEFETQMNKKYYWHTVTPCNSNGHINSVLEIRRDITEKKKISEFDGLRQIVNRIVTSQDKLTNKIKDIAKNE